ncbi:MAG: UDP-3-O-acyl-N-acetylglucosamine deacetylase, partial [Candidatus Erginobacter occultus]|nr:UDP-3-O-acyl-N-acetylglucosamine deacetylase [Candidatus Erginobacter occultus]
MANNNPPLQKTLARTVRCRGIGVHTGLDTELEIRPAAADRGIVLFRSDLPGSSEIPARVEAVSQTIRGTSLGPAESGVKTVEHLLAVLSGLEIDNAVVEMNGPELPMGDGSALPFLRLVNEAGIRELAAPRRFRALRRAVVVETPGGIVTALPSPRFRIACTIAFADPLLDAQFRDLEITPEVFSREVAPARTFGFYREALPLLKQGLIRGTGLDNTVVIGPGAVFSRGGLRFDDECVR